ncbi:MAG TPA: sugar ABC transporter ATP-binding protein [Anaerolineae bacterium]|nr:sugar ABC transporter ATP-binding protein [Anaerolineae bacterium]
MSDVKPDETVLQVRGVFKHFGGVQALRGVSMDVRRGEVHALVGENGAGKTTLMNVLGGIVLRDSGQVEFNGRPVEFATPAESQAAGIAIIHQEPATLPALSVMENIFMGRMPARRGWVDSADMEQRTRELLDEVGLDVRPQARLRELSTSHAQLVEIAKALSLNAGLIIMDEPNSSLTERETHRLFEVIRQLKAKGVSIIFVSHRIEEVLQIADRITVLRDGNYVGTLTAQEATVDRVISMMVGRELVRAVEPDGRHTGELLLEVRGLTRKNVVRNVSFSLRRGEILGLAGLVGAGRSETARIIFGADQPDAGEIVLEGKPVRMRSPKDALEHGLGMVPEDRKKMALFMIKPVRWNITMARLPRLSVRGIVNRPQEKAVAEEFVQRLRVRVPHIETIERNLSGGNQQKTVLARWLATSPKLLILDEPTHGVDVGAKAEIYEMIRDLARQGIGIILISSELPEILTMSDRIVVMHEGRVTGILDRSEATEDKVMAYATGIAGNGNEHKH